MNKDRSQSEKLIRSLESQGFKAIMLTVDAAVPGNREIDKRSKGTVAVRLTSIVVCLLSAMGVVDERV